MKKETTEQQTARLRKQFGHSRNAAKPVMYKKRNGVKTDKGKKDAESYARAFEI